MKHAVGQLVVNKKLGFGKVLEVSGDSVTVFFKDQTDNPRTINVAVMPMEIPKEQSDPFFEDPKWMRKWGEKLPAKKRAVKRATGKAKQAGAGARGEPGRPITSVGEAAATSRGT